MSDFCQSFCIKFHLFYLLIKLNKKFSCLLLVHRHVCTKPQINQLNYKADKCLMRVLFSVYFIMKTTFFVCTKLLWLFFFTLWFSAHSTIVVRLCLGSMPCVVNSQGRKRKTLKATGVCMCVMCDLDVHYIKLYYFLHTLAS